MMGGGMWGRRLLLLIEGSVWVGARIVLMAIVGEKAGLRCRRSGYCFLY